MGEIPRGVWSGTVESVRFVPVGLFSSVMGIGGLALAWRRAAAHWGLPDVIWQVLAGALHPGQQQVVDERRTAVCCGPVNTRRLRPMSITTPSPRSTTRRMWLCSKA